MQERILIAAHDAILAWGDVSWGHGHEYLASLYTALVTIVGFWLAALYSIRFMSRVLLRRPLPVGASASEGKRTVEDQETDQGMRSKRRCAVLWLGALFAAPLLIWCCDMGVNELHRRSVINCFRAADRVIVEYHCSQRDDSNDDVTFFTGKHEITKKQHLAAIARDLSGIRPDGRQSKFLFILPTGIVMNWGGPLKVSVYNVEDATPRQFMINGEALYERGWEGRVFLHSGMGALTDLVSQSLEPDQGLWW